MHTEMREWGEVNFVNNLLINASLLELITSSSLQFKESFLTHMQQSGGVVKPAHPLSRYVDTSLIEFPKF